MQKRILTVMFTVLMLTAVLSGCAPEKYYSITELPETDFSEMTYGEADYMSQFNEAVSAVREKVHVGADFSEIESILDGMDNILIEIQNNFDLSLIHMRLDNSAENIAKNKTASDNIHAVSETYNTLLDELYNSEYKQQFLDSAEGEFDEEDFLNKPSDRFYELKKLETELIAEYYQKSGNAVNSNDTTLGVLFKELVNVRTEIAKERGYDSYADYAYKEVFNRDYTTDDTEKLHKHIKEIVAPISAELAKKSSMNTWGEGNFTEDEVLKFLGTCAEGMGSEVKAAYDCMLENHLYSIDYSSSKAMSNAYTTYMRKYKSPFIFSNGPSIKAVVHEFGHFNQLLYNGENEKRQNIDLQEVHSQGFELLSLEFYDMLYKERADIQRMDTVNTVFSGVVQMSLFDEWQTEVYKNPDMSVSEMDVMFAKLAEEYSMENIGGHEWVKVPHVFIQPMYNISYTVSGLAAMEIWSMSLDSRSKAVDMYMRLTAADCTRGFKEVTTECGFNNIFEEKTLNNIAKTVKKGFLD